MVEVRIESKAEFSVLGVKRFISELQHFSQFWQECHENGTIEKLRKLNAIHGQPITNGSFIGLSCTEHHPEVRTFDFFVCIEFPSHLECSESFEQHHVNAHEWAIFSQEGTGMDALYSCEMHAFKEWLPASNYAHANGPEMEIYFEDHIEFWLPISPSR